MGALGPQGRAAEQSGMIEENAVKGARGLARIDMLRLVHEYGLPYSKMLSIDLREGDGAYSKWFLASLLYSRHIREETATGAYRAFVRRSLTDPPAIIEAGWGRLVGVLDEGSYTRYDFSTARMMLAVYGSLVSRYGGRLSRLYDSASDSRDLEDRLKGLGKGVGQSMISIFLRDMRMVWPKADPPPTPRVREAMSALGIGDLGEFARGQGLDRVELETALHRYSRLSRQTRRGSSKREPASGAGCEPGSAFTRPEAA